MHMMCKRKKICQFVFVIVLIVTLGSPFTLSAKTDKKEDWQPFVEWWDDDKVNTVTDFHFLHPSPAAKRVLAEGQKFVFEDGEEARFLGVNILRSSCFLTKDQAEKTATRLSKLGCNLVRFARVDATHSKKIQGRSSQNIAFKGPLDSFIDTSRQDTQHLDLEAMDRFDYFLSKLKEKGIYIWLDLCDLTRNFKKGDRVPLTGKENAYSDDEFARKQTYLWEKRAIELQYHYVLSLLEHVNPYTKVQLKNEPALAFICLINKAVIIPRRAILADDTYTKLKVLWNVWLAKNPHEFTLQPQEILGDIEVPVTWYKNGKGYTNEKREELFQDFLYEQRKKYVADYKKFLQKLGYKGLILGTQTIMQSGKQEGKLAKVMRERQLDNSDLIDFHGYTNKSIAKRERERLFTNAIDEPAVKRSKIFSKNNFKKRKYVHMEFFNGHKWGKPCSLSGFAESYPSPWRCEILPLVAYLSRKNGVDAALFFSYNSPRKLFESISGSSRLKKLPSYTIFFNDPATMGTFRAAAMIMHKVNPEKECVWDTEKGFLKVNSSLIQGGTGYFQKRESFKDIIIETNDFASIYSMSCDQKSILDSGRILISAVSQAQNTGFMYNRKRGIISNGIDPIRINPVRAEISLLLKEKRRDIEVWALNSYGERIEKINGKTVKGSSVGTLWFTFSIGGQKEATIYYEVKK